ncbi:COG4223 family protein [Pseudophaeobacter leonis]|uniref:COG4223 family protein n=1 Tax=Pseudophaeobacter leonis TaxID=1144477 RepID=UPI0009F42B02|nr:mitofilin family membrane protein [Pseudophaeobacter leonis]
MADKKTADDVTRQESGAQDLGAGEAQTSETASLTAEDQVAREAVDVEELDDVLSYETETETETETEESAVEPELQTAERVSEEAVSEPDLPREIERIIEKRGGFGAALLGGAVAAVLGFVVGQGGLLNSVLPASLQGATAVDMTAFEVEQSALKSQIAALQAQLGEIKLPDIAPLDQRLTTVEEAVTSLSAVQPADPDAAAKLAALTARLDQIEARPITEAASPEVVAAFENELSKLQEKLAAQRAEVEGMLAEAREMELSSVEAARIAAAQTALAKIRVSLDTGGAYLSAVSELQAQQVEVPAALSGTAETGVVTLDGLREAFTPAAREALALARDETKGSGGLMDYVNRHLAARSTSPQQGDGADAVLSRAEAAIHSGDLDLALQELDTLPEAARAALADWQASARARLAAPAAVDQLAQSLNAK